MTSSTHAHEITPSTRQAIFLLSFATFSSMAVQRICDPMLPELSRIFEAPMGEVAQVISLFAVTYGVMQLFYGPVGDRWGKYRVVQLATLMCSIGCVLSALSTNLQFLIIARVLTALCAAAIIPLSMAWVGDVVHYQNRQENLAKVGLGTMLGITAGQLVGGMVTDSLGWRWAFVLMALVFSGVSLRLWLQLRRRELPPQHPHVSVGFFKQLYQVGADPWARTLLGVAFLEGASMFGLLAVTPTHLHQTHHMSLTMAGSTAALFGLGGMAYMATAKQTIRRFGEVGLAKYGGLALGLSFLLVAFSPWWPVAIPACFVGGFGFAMFHNTMQAKATQMVPTARATGVTLFAGFLFLGQSVGVLLLASLISHMASMWVIGADAIFTAVLGAYFASAIAKRNATQADHA